MVKTKTLAVLFALGLSSSLLGGCPKKDATPNDGVVNPSQAFTAGVKLLETPGKDGGGEK